MAARDTDDWPRQVGRVFDSRPRIGGIDDPLWMNRAKEQDALTKAIQYPGVHICLDGPSGSGKTSLAKTVFERHSRTFPDFKWVYVRVNHKTDWTRFKSSIITTANASSLRQGTQTKLGLRSLLPFLEFTGSVGAGARSRRLAKQDIVDRIDIQDIAAILVTESLTLAIDDLDLASDDLVTQVADLCKEVSDQGGDASGKVVLVGTNDIYRRVLKTYSALRDRIDEVTLGSIPDRHIAWNFIVCGLEALGLRRPEDDKHISRDQLRMCRDAVHDAVDGLPKSIVSLGRQLGQSGKGRRRISYSDITREAQETVRRNFRDFRSKYRRIIHLVKTDPLIRAVCRWLFARGISRIHDVSEMAEDLHEVATYDLLEGALEQLEQEKFLVRTGRDDDVFFAQDPLMVHTLGVALDAPEKCDVERGYFRGMEQQLLLRFTNERDPERPH